jgi:hypothetical protein
MRLRPLDIAAFVLAAIFVLLAAHWAYAPGTGTPEVIVSGAKGEWIYPLAVDRSVKVAGPLGLTSVEIQGKAVRITDSPCKNKLCIAMGSISSPGQWVACLPNRVFVRIEGRTAKAKIDAASY